MHAGSASRLGGLAISAVLLCFVVVVFGAFVRLSNAGLSCPDWPTCYGALTWPVQADDIARANAKFERPVEVGKASREQVHRLLAGALVLVTFALAWLCWRARGDRASRLPTDLSPVEAYARIDPPWRAALLVAALIVFQALLGMWTVTLKLKPIIVMAHLLGGMTTLALLVWIASRLRASASAPGPLFGAAPRGSPSRAALVVGIVLVGLQIALGGWTSTNYAALACGFDFPKCNGAWWPAVDFREGFVLWRGIGVDYEGGVLDGPARAAIQLAHRVFALVVAGHLLALGLRALRVPDWRRSGGVLLALVGVQMVLGIANVKLGLPLWIATAHTAGAALLLSLLVGMLARAAYRVGAQRIAATAPGVPA